MEAGASPPRSVSVGGGFGGARGDASAFSFLSKGWREVRDSATADLRLMRARADSLRTLADRELEHLLASASTALAAAPPPPPLAAGAPIAELEFVRTRIQPKISELRRRYASRERDLGRRVLEGWAPGGPARARVDLSGITAIRNAIVSEADGGERWRRAAWKGEAEEGKEWEVVRMIRDGIKEFERRRQTSEIFEGLRSTGELVEKFKSSLVILHIDSTNCSS